MKKGREEVLRGMGVSIAALLFTVLPLGSGPAWADDTQQAAAREAEVVLRDGMDGINLSGFISLLPNAPEKMSIQDVVQPKIQQMFSPQYDLAVNRGLTTQPLWVRVCVRNPGAVRDWVLEVTNARLAKASLYMPNPDGTYTERSMGTGYPLSNRDYLYAHPAFNIRLPGGVTTFYLRLHHTGAMRFRLLLWERAAFMRRTHVWMFIVFVAEGMLLAMAAQSMLLYLGARERSYLFYSLLMFAFLIVHMASYGTSHLFLWPNAHWWTDHSTTFLALLLLCASLIFSNSLLNGRENTPVLSRLATYLTWVCLVTAVACLFVEHVIKFYVAHMLGLMVPGLAMLMGIQAWRRGFRPAKIFVMAWGALVVGSVVLALLGMGLLPGNFWTEHMIDLSLFTGMFLWSFSLTDRLKKQEEEIRSLLVSTVRERTTALNKALVEVKTLHGLLPICSRCKKIRDDHGYWQNLESYISAHTDADFSHSLCPSCIEDLYPEFYQRNEPPAAVKDEGSVS